MRDPRPFLVASFALALSPTAGAGDVPWGTDLMAALRTAAETGHPVLVHVTANPCGYKAPIGDPGDVHETDCEKLELLTLSKPAFAEAATRFVPVVASHTARAIFGEGGAGRDLFREWKVATVPTLLVSDPWGNEVIRLVGPTPLDKTVRVLNAIPDDFGPLRAAGEALRADPERLDALRAAAAFYESAGLRPVAERYYERAALSPGAKADAGARRDVVIARGLNLLRMGQSKDAARLFSDEAGHGLDAAQSDVVLFGWAMASLAAGDRAKAGSIAEDLKKRFPASAYTQRLQENLNR
jgi:hypothetical protein